MTNNAATLTGVVKGRTIQLAQDPGFPDGQEVSVSLRPAPLKPDMEALRRAFGGWGTEDDPELTAFLEQIRQDRKVGRPPIEP